MASTARQDRWFLEVVRGRDVGKRLTVEPGESVLGNALAGAPGFDLANQEQPNSPRRMAARQASLTLRDNVLELRDLESPGGTFVNRQRLLSSQSRALQPGDVIQLGGVQLVVDRELTAAPGPRAAPREGEAPAEPRGTSTRQEPHAPTRQEPRPPGNLQGRSAVEPQPAYASFKPGQLSIPYMIAGAGTCRTWDDFLTLAAQRWGLVRDELTSGRIAEHMKRVQRFDLVPRPEPGQNADERLDAWLGRLPASRSSAPELDVHPEMLTVRASTGGGLVRQKLKITNVGYRLLKGSVRVESPRAGRIRVMASSEGDSFVSIDQTELLIEFELGDDVLRFPSGSALGAVIIESNGGTKRVEVRLERPSAPQLVPEPGPGTSPIDLNAWTRPLGDRIAALPLARRLVLAPLALMVFRLLLALSALIPPLPGSLPGSGGLRLDAITVLLAATGVLAGAVWAARGGDGQDANGRRELASAGFAGGMIGLFAAA
ncbi:MAG: FHA domain-containing protein, partial [Isosphaeraceae bacterium]